MATLPASLQGINGRLDTTREAQDSPKSQPQGTDLANQTVFLQLLVTQLKNQSPDRPADGTEFVAQLAQFVTLEQETRSRTDLDKILALLEERLAPAAASNLANTIQAAASGTGSLAPASQAA